MADFTKIISAVTEKRAEKASEKPAAPAAAPTRQISVPQTPKTVRAAAENAKSHSIELDNHKLLRVTGVLAVPVFTDKTISVELSGETLTVTGRDLTVKSLDVENGTLNAEGYVTGMKYSSQQTPQSLLKRIFK